jgi:hypothetical protein
VAVPGDPTIVAAAAAPPVSINPSATFAIFCPRLVFLASSKRACR